VQYKKLLATSAYLFAIGSYNNLIYIIGFDSNLDIQIQKIIKPSKYWNIQNFEINDVDRYGSAIYILATLDDTSACLFKYNPVGNIIQAQIFEGEYSLNGKKLSVNMGGTLFTCISTMNKAYILEISELEFNETIRYPNFEITKHYMYAKLLDATVNIAPITSPNDTQYSPLTNSTTIQIQKTQASFKFNLRKG